MAEGTESGTALGGGSADPNAANAGGTADPNAANAGGTADPNAAKPAADPSKDQGKKAEGAPEKYEAFKVPEGFTSSEVLVKEFEPLARELNLTQEGAQKLVDFGTKMVQQATEQVFKQGNDMVAEWLAEAKADKTLGGQNFDQSIALGKKAIDALHEAGLIDGPALRKALDFTGVGNHVEFIRFFAAIGKFASEDKLDLGKSSAPPRDAASVLFPTMAQKS